VHAVIGAGLGPSALVAVEGAWHPYAADLQGLAALVVGITLLAAGMLSISAWERLRRAAWNGRLPGRIGALQAEGRPSHDRPQGYKVAKLVADPSSGAGSFLGLTVGGLYHEDTAASCEVLTGWLPPPRRWGRRRKPPPHDVPDLGCTCGFYAFHDPAEAVALLSERPPVSRLFGLVLLEVDLAGTVIEFDRGFRASHQRVLGVQVPPWCVPCATIGRAEPARRLAGLAGPSLADELQAELPRYPPAYRLALTVHHRALLERLAGRAPLRAVCDEHTPRATDEGEGSPPLVLEVADLAARLGTEVRWLDDEEAFDLDGFVDAMSWSPPGRRRAA
jgi:hypothetical protein